MPASGSSSFWGDSWTLLFNRPSASQRIRREFRRMTELAQGEIAKTLDGVIAGSTATQNRAQLTATPGLTNDQGGLRTVANVALVNRATVAGDVTVLNAIYNPGPYAPSTYPVDTSGNGGGGKGNT